MRIAPAALILSMLPLSAQDAPIIRPGNFELGGFAGVSVVSNAEVKGSLGGNLAYSLTRTFMPYAEISYFPKNDVEFGVPGLAGATSQYNTSALDYSAGLHVRAPLPHSRIVPYGIIGLGGFRYSGKLVEGSFQNPFNPQDHLTTVATRATNTDLAVSYGGGIRYYMHEAFGFRVEAKAYQPINSLIAHRFVRCTAGVFLQLR